MNVIGRLQAWSLRASGLLGLIGFLAILGVSILTVIDVLLRWLADAPILGVNDIILLVTTVGVSACFASGMAERQHMRVTASGRVIGGRIGHNLFEVIGSLITLGFFGVMVWQFVKRSYNFTIFGDYSTLLHIPVGPFWWAATFAFGVAAIAQFIVVLDDLGGLLTNRPIPEPREDGDPMLSIE
jgi:TRAP-type C4-dicarboxylate transport system permease small subunit